MFTVKALAIVLRSDVHHIPKGASYFRIARPLRFRVSHSTGFLVTNRRRIRITMIAERHDVHFAFFHTPMDSIEQWLSGDCKPIQFNEDRHLGGGQAGLEPATRGL